MDIAKLIETFEKMDISKPFSKKPNPQMGSINVRDTEYGLMVSMFELKKNIGELDNSAKLKYLNGLNLPIPKRIFFDTDNDRVNIIEQAFFQAANDWYDFIEAYKEYLKNSLSDNRSSERHKAFFKDKKNDNLAERLDLLDQKFKVKHVITLDEAEGQSNGRFKPGSIGLAYPPIPPDPKDAFRLFQNYYGIYQFEVQKSLFFDTYRSFENENAINAEMEVIEDFIKEVEKISYKDVCNNLNNKDQPYEYKRLTGGFYEDYMMDREQHNVNSAAASVYGRYVLFYDYLKRKKASFIPPFKEVEPFNMDQNNIEGTIEDLTEANLEKHGIDNETITKFFDSDIPLYEHTFFNPKGIVFASAKEGKIYSGFAGARKVYFNTHFVNFPYKYPQLTAEYHEIKLAEHINSKKRLMGSIYDENSEKRLFIDKQILWVKSEIGKNVKEKENCKYNYQLDEALSLKRNIEILESYSAFLNRLNTENKDIIKSQQANDNSLVKSNIAKPKFKSEVVDVVFNILKDFFCQENQDELRNILLTGDSVSTKLIFLDSGNRLADAFKQLYDADFISSCQKNELEKWISENFSFRYRADIREFKIKYLNDIISTTKDKCQKPILNVKSGLILRAQ